MPEHHLSAGGGDLRHRSAAASGQDLFAKQFERDDVDATEAVKPVGACQLTFGLESCLLGHDPIDGLAQWIARSGITDRAEAAMRLSCPCPADDEAHSHLNNPLTDEV